MNGLEIEADVDEQEHLMLALASGEIDRLELVAWLRGHTQPR